MGVFIEQIRDFIKENPGTISLEQESELETKASQNKEGYIPTCWIVQAVGYPTAMLIEFYNSL